MLLRLLRLLWLLRQSIARHRRIHLFRLRLFRRLQCCFLTSNGFSHAPKFVLQIQQFFRDGTDIGQVRFDLEIGDKFFKIVLKLLGIVFFGIEVGFGKALSDFDDPGDSYLPLVFLHINSYKDQSLISKLSSLPSQSKISYFFGYFDHSRF